MYFASIRHYLKNLTTLVYEAVDNYNTGNGGRGRVGGSVKWGWGGGEAALLSRLIWACDLITQQDGSYHVLSMVSVTF